MTKFDKIVSITSFCLLCFVPISCTWNLAVKEKDSKGGEVVIDANGEDKK